MVTREKVLTQNQEAEIRALEARCREEEGWGREVFLSAALNHHLEMNCFFQFREGEALVGFLVRFAPEADKAEVTAFVHPDYRQCGIFSALLAAAKEELTRFNVSTVLFCHEPVPSALSGLWLPGENPL